VEPAGIALLAAAGLLLLWVGGTYNGLVRVRNHAREAWSLIDTELKRRHDLVPNLVECVRGYAQHEREVLDRLASARAAAARGGRRPETVGGPENRLAALLRQVYAVAEAYPALRADSSFLALQRELANTEDRIQAARRFYNANVRDLNNRVQVFPSNLLARMFRFGPMPFLELEEARMRAAPEVRL
jgi:LemA protein